MTDTKDDTPAYPVTAGNHVHATGMSLRDYFAGQALAGLATKGWAISAPEAAYEMADAMLRAREQGEG